MGPSHRRPVVGDKAFAVAALGRSTVTAGGRSSVGVRRFVGCVGRFAFNTQTGAVKRYAAPAGFTPLAVASGRVVRAGVCRCRSGAVDDREGVTTSSGSVF